MAPKEAELVQIYCDLVLQIQEQRSAIAAAERIRGALSTDLASDTIKLAVIRAQAEGVLQELNSLGVQVPIVMAGASMHATIAGNAASSNVNGSSNNVNAASKDANANPAPARQAAKLGGNPAPTGSKFRGVAVMDVIQRTQPNIYQTETGALVAIACPRCTANAPGRYRRKIPGRPEFFDFPGILKHYRGKHGAIGDAELFEQCVKTASVEVCAADEVLLRKGVKPVDPAIVSIRKVAELEAAGSFGLLELTEEDTVDDGPVKKARKGFSI